MNGTDVGIGAGVELRDVVRLGRDAREDGALEDLGARRRSLVDRDVVRHARVLVVEIDLERSACLHRQVGLLVGDVLGGDLERLGGTSAAGGRSTTRRATRGTARWRG